MSADAAKLLKVKAPIVVIGGGLAGSEAAWQIGKRGYRVRLYEMKPQRFSAAHKSPLLAELVCSNSLGANTPNSAPGLLKAELRCFDSLIMAAAALTAVPAGRALAVAREEFSRSIEAKLASCAKIEIIREEITSIPQDAILIVAAGPLCSEMLAADIARITGAEHLYFYDAISPIVAGDSLDYSRMFWASRHEVDSADYLNIPLNKEECESFYRELITASEVPFHNFEEPKYFEGCLPVEVIARRGIDTLRFGAMKPVGIVDPRSGKTPYALVQLRREDEEGRLFNLVGFQTKLKWAEQKRVFSLLPGMENASFARFGALHRNTFINSPRLLEGNLALRDNGNILFAGQITGVEGYLESTAMGLLAGLNALALATGVKLPLPPSVTAIGALLRHITSPAKNFQPMNINFGLLPSLDAKLRKRERGERYTQRALTAFNDFTQEIERLLPSEQQQAG